ncbi:hypothetical protein AAC387_Pa06g0087 [Persea americana]
MIACPSEKRHVAPATHFLRTIKCLDRRKDKCLDRRKDECLDRRKDECLDRRKDTSMSRPTSAKDKEEPSLNRDSTISAMLHTPGTLKISGSAGLTKLLSFRPTRMSSQVKS